MWDRKEWKASGKAAFQANYWKCVLVAFLMLLLIGGGLGAAGSRAGNVNFQFNSNNVSFQNSGDLEGVLNSFEGENITQLPGEIRQYLDHQSDGLGAAWIPILMVVSGILGVVILAGSVVKILVMNPLEVGCKNFFLRNGEGPASLNEVSVGFNDWGRNVKTMFLRDLFLFLWSLLFVIPGLVKAYSYRLVPYLLADDPELQGTEAITLSRQMMRGHKWRAFVLDLSFLGWEILSGLTAGLLGIFYVNPYVHATDAELYRVIRESL